MTQADIQAALELVADDNIFIASRHIADLLNIPLDIAYDFMQIVRFSK